MPARYVPTHKVKCAECKWSETYDTLALAESAVRLHNKDEHPEVISTLDGITLKRDGDTYTITMTKQDLDAIDGQTLTDTVSYMAGVAKYGE